MDDLVMQAMAKWPNVPDCYGWLGLDARGNWYLRDDAAQAAGPFGEANRQAKGSLLQHEKLIEFIARNYSADDHGCWFFQNGPQRVFVELQCTPWIWRIHNDFSLVSHTGAVARLLQCLLDEEGKVYIETELGLGLVHTQDVELAANAIESGVWLTQAVMGKSLPARFRYVLSPKLLQKEKQNT